MDESQTGQTVTPDNGTQSTPVSGVSQPTTPPVTASPQQTSEQTPAVSPLGDFLPSQSTQADLQPVRWSASEYIEHEKSATWYGALTLGGIVLAIVTFVMTRDFVSAGIVLVATLGLAFFASRTPKTQSFELSDKGLQVGSKLYLFSEFKSFSVSEDGPIANIMLMPLKRFMPPLTIYVDPDQEDEVTDFLAAYLPIEIHKQDVIDSLVKRLRF